MKCVHTVKGMSFHAFHGILEVERELGQVYYVDAILEYDKDPAGLSQKDEPLIREGGVFDVTRNVIMETKFRSISSLAGTIARNMLEKFDKVQCVTICIDRKQLFIPGNVDSSVTEVKFCRSDLEAEKTESTKKTRKK